MASPANDRGQMLLAEEYFATENALFLETLRKVGEPKTIAGFVDRWKKDPRPWARAQILAYLAEPLASAGHQPVVKRFFKQAEESGDSELMAVFLVVFDKLVRREIRTKRRWDFRTRSVNEEEKLVTPRDVIPLNSSRSAINPATGETMSYQVRARGRGRLFRYRTRYYLRRRAWRYFRRLGFRNPAAYLPAIADALKAYQDADLAKGENILDSWGLMHACFAGSQALEIGATHIQLKEGSSLGDLAPAPAFVDEWKKPEAAQTLLSLATGARSRLVRVWAMQLFELEHLNSPVPLEAIVALLDHEDAEVQQFGARLFQNSPALASLPISSWLKLLGTKNNDALQRICDAFTRHVSGDRLDLTQCMAIACSTPVPVAQLGLNFLKQRNISGPADRQQIVELAGAKCAAVAGGLTTWALGILGKPENYSGDQVIRFLDSMVREAREAAWTWMMSSPPALADAVLWSRLAETPYDDVRLHVIDFLKRNTEAAGVSADNLQNIWRSVLLGVHRGGRQKTKAVQQISRAIAENPARVDTLLPVLAVAVRSVRGPEARAGIAAIAALVESQPQLAATVSRHLPELKLEAVAA